ALKHRQNKKQQQRIIVFAGSPVKHEKKVLEMIGRNVISASSLLVSPRLRSSSDFLWFAVYLIHGLSDLLGIELWWRFFDAAKLKKLRANFKQNGGTVTAGNASSIRSVSSTMSLLIH
ncbi:hypothetical protein HN51_040539, partial [Arachis hypogaea]